MSEPARIGAVDAVRGLAILGMITFHLAWDLHAFGWIDLDPSQSAAWEFFGHAVASCFLFLSGLGLVMARQRGIGTVRALRRIGVIAAAALVVTGATLLATPGEAVWFGVLHCIALANLLALPLLGALPAAILGLAAVAIAIPAAVAGRAPAPWWWLGLSDKIPSTIDVRPLLPWLGVVLLGVWFGRVGGLARLRRDGRLSGPGLLALAGRHSLVIYLVHQPVLFGLFWIAAAIGLVPTRPIDPLAEAAFAAECQAACIKTTPYDQCTAFCACARSRLSAAGARPSSSRLAEAASACDRDLQAPGALH